MSDRGATDGGEGVDEMVGEGRNIPGAGRDGDRD